MNRINKILLSLLLIVTVCFTACGDIPSSQPADSSSQSQPAESRPQAETRRPGPHPIAILHREKIYSLENAGFTIETANESQYSSGVVKFDLIFYPTGSEEKVTVPITGFVRKYSNHDDYVWGTLNYADGDVILTTLKDITVYNFLDNAGSYTVSPLLDVSRHLGENYYLVDTLKDGDIYYIGYMTETDRGILQFDKSTGSVKNNILPCTEYDGKYFGYFSSDDWPVIKERTHIKFMDNKHRYIMVLYNAGMTEFVYCTEDNKPYDISTVIHFDNDETETDIEVFRIFKDGKDREYFAQITKNGTAQHIFMSGDFVRNIAWDIEGDWLDWDYDDTAGILKMSNSLCGQQLTFDFNNKKVTSQYFITADHAQQEGATSPDGSYVLYYSDFGGGDTVCSNVIIYDKNTDKYSYIAEIGGMYGAGSGAGFFANGDIYIIDYGTFNVYTPDMQGKQPVFSMGDHLPLGDNVEGKGTARYLLSARRNPQDFSFVGLYVEIPENYTFIENSIYMNSTYKIALLDSNGNITKTIDTGENVAWTGFHRVSMYMAQDNVIHFDESLKGEIQRSFEVNLITGRCTQIR